MTDRVAVVTDSTAYLPPGIAAAHGVAVVPVQVVISGQAHDEDAITPADVAEALREWRPVTTSRPSPQAFHETYEKLAAAGAIAIVSVHLSAAMQQHARVGAAGRAGVLGAGRGRRQPGRWAWGMGFAVVAAAEAAAAGADVATVAGLRTSGAADASEFFYVDTLEYLRRGGRIGAAAALLGLGPVGQAAAARGRRAGGDAGEGPYRQRALARLEDVAVERAGDRGPRRHRRAPPRQPCARCRPRRVGAADPGCRTCGELVVSEVGAVVGAHVGPGMLAVVVAPR